MRLRYRSGLLGWMLILSALIFVAPTVEGQSNLPELEQLTVELWPEYDRSDVLVIYRAELSPQTALPAQLAFRLPGYIDGLHAVAVEHNGALFAVDQEEIELSQEDEALLLTFPVTSRNFQLEYYDPMVLARQDQDRQIDFNFVAPYEIERVTFQVQEPLQAEEFLLSPAPTGSFTDPNGLRYSSIDMAGLRIDDTVELRANYKRVTDEPSIQLLGQALPQSSGIEAVVPSGSSFSAGYIFLAAGVALLLITLGGYWWWSKRSGAETTYRRKPARKRPARGKKRPAAASTRAKKRRAREAPSSEAPARFCYRCGAALRPEATFCHSCGAARRSV